MRDSETKRPEPVYRVLPLIKEGVVHHPFSIYHYSNCSGGACLCELRRLSDSALSKHGDLEDRVAIAKYIEALELDNEKLRRGCARALGFISGQLFRSRDVPKIEAALNEALVAD